MYEVVIIWETGEKEVLRGYNDRNRAEEVEAGYHKAFGNQVSWSCVRETRGGDRMTSAAQVRASKKYDAANTVQIKLKLNVNTDADILARLESENNKQGYIKALIRADISKA